MTFLEAVFATLMLGMVAATLVGLTGSLRLNSERQRQLLGAAEMANRLIIIVADDESLLPSPGVPVEYGGFRYRWRIGERRVSVVPSEASVAAAESSGTTRPSSSMSLDRRLKVYTIDVWLAEDAGGALVNGPGVPSVSLSRLHDPLAFTNPDQSSRRIERDLEGVFGDILGAAGGGDGSDGGRTIGGEQQPGGG